MINWDWLIGRAKLRRRVEELEKVVQDRENQIIQASIIVEKCRLELQSRDSEILILQTENNLLNRISK